MENEEIEKPYASVVEKKEKIVLYVLRCEGEFSYSEWYTIDLGRGQVTECPYALLGDTGMNSMVTLGSVIYVIGGLRGESIACDTKPPHSKCTKKGLFHKGMSYLDLTNDIGDGWKQAPCPSEGPSPCPAVVLFDGKIYLFHYGSKTKTAEVFDPISNKWETLDPPPDVGFFNIWYSTSVVADPQNNCILVYFRSIQSVYAYYPADNRWELVVKPFGWSSKLVSVDGVIYFYLPEQPEFIAAYHVASKQWLNIAFTSKLSGRIWRYDFDAIMYLGDGLMCLASSYSSSCPPQTHVYLAKFTFERPSPADLLITPLPTETYTLDTAISIHQFFPV